MPETPHLRIDRPSDGVVLLTLDNPEQRNAMSDEMTSSWSAAVDRLALDRSVRAVVVTGAGTAFCSFPWPPGPKTRISRRLPSNFGKIPMARSTFSSQRSAPAERSLGALK